MIIDRYANPQDRYSRKESIFGSSIPSGEIEDIMSDYEKVMAALRIEREIQRKIFGETMVK